MRGRVPVNWNEELRKTKKIQIRGLCISAFSLVFALAMIGGVKFYRPEIPVLRGILPALSVMFAVAILFFLVRKRWKK